MSNDITEAFFSWIDEQGISTKEVAEELGNSPQTISNWRSIGIPKGKRFACEAFMQRYMMPLEEPSCVLVLKPTHAQFSAWNEAALQAGKTIEQWAFDGLEIMAKEQLRHSSIRVAEVATKVDYRNID